MVWSFAGMVRPLKHSGANDVSGHGKVPENTVRVSNQGAENFRMAEKAPEDPVVDVDSNDSDFGGGRPYHPEGRGRTTGGKVTAAETGSLMMEISIMVTIETERNTSERS